jgi:2-keto-4-pentenoate hydratase/2-oxohepta-3-ene-1,7-dioic acid hydratase in catechol pathway
MKFLTLEDGQLGAVLGETVVDLVEASQVMGKKIRVNSLKQLVEVGDETTETAWNLAQSAATEGCATREFAYVKPLAPLPQPRRNIFCVGKNYLEHTKKLVDPLDKGDEIPHKPIIFTKSTSSVISSGMPIPSHSKLTSKLDYEAELALVIGKEGKNIPLEQAWDYVFGYTAINDVTARDLQTNHSQWFRGKSLDGFAPMGPILVHRSVMPPLNKIEICCWVNGEQRQQATLDQLIFDIPTIISILSAGATLLPGDIIATGTPSGVGMSFNPPCYLQSNDEITIYVTGVGRLVNWVA